MSGENAPILPDKHGGLSEVEIIGDEDVERHGGGLNKLPTVFSHLKPNQMPHKWKRTLYGITGILIAAGIAAGIVIGLWFGFVSANSFSRFPGSIEIDNLMTHLQAFQDIAGNYSNSRSPFYGYNATVEYVYKVLTDNTDLSVSIQPFSFSYTFEPTASTLSLNSGGKSTPVASGTEWLSAANQGAGNVTGGFSFVPNLGCNATDYDNTTIAGKITVIQRGTCTFTSKAVFSESAGAIGVLVVNTEGEPIPYVGLGQTVSLPVFVISYDLGFSIQLLSQTDPNVTATMTSSSETLTVYTSNVIADTLTGNPNSTIVVGSHLDSVTAGPGINDNGSGSSANLEMALNINKVTLSNRVRFAWWGAEELGLRGSEAYVASLSPAQLAEIALNLNFDMLGSPNYYRGVYDGRSAQPMNSLVYNGSATIQQLFETFWSDKDLPCDSSSFDGRSDYGPFLAKDIPCGGLFTGAEVIKSEAFVARYGGLANTAYDPCYHQWCDTVLNINQDVYEDMAQAAATVLETLAIQSDLTSYFAENATPGEDHVPCAPVETTAAPKRQLTASHRVFI